MSEKGLCEVGQKQGESKDCQGQNQEVLEEGQVGPGEPEDY